MCYQSGIKTEHVGPCSFENNALVPLAGNQDDANYAFNPALFHGALPLGVEAAFQFAHPLPRLFVIGNQDDIPVAAGNQAVAGNANQVGGGGNADVGNPDQADGGGPAHPLGRARGPGYRRRGGRRGAHHQGGRGRARNDGNQGRAGHRGGQERAPGQGAGHPDGNLVTRTISTTRSLTKRYTIQTDVNQNIVKMHSVEIPRETTVISETHRQGV